MFYCKECKRDKPDKERVKVTKYRAMCADCVLKLKKENVKLSGDAFEKWREGL